MGRAGGDRTKRRVSVAKHRVVGIEVGRLSRDVGAVSGNSLQRGWCRNTAGAWSSPRHGRVADAIKGPANRLARAKKGK